VVVGVSDEAAVWWPSRFGPEDQLGMLNHITDATRAAALRLVRSGRLYDLGRVLDDAAPVFQGRYFRQTLVTTAHHSNGGGLGANRVNWITEQIAGTQQLGTHLDALCHLQIGDRGYNGWTVTEVADTAGVKRLGVETVPQIVTRGWLAKKGVALTGCDTWSYGPIPAEDAERPFEVPQFLSVRHGVFIVENLDTSKLARDGIREFALILSHPKLRGASGAWTSPVALV
jgi:kynurenine formamidase